jgi:hypothetical protein
MPPGGAWRTQEEIDHYLARIARLTLPDTETERFVTGLRSWAEADDGKATYMVNLNRYLPTLRLMERSCPHPWLPVRRPIRGPRQRRLQRATG